MKYLFPIIFLLFVGVQAFAQMDPDKALYAEKLAKYSRMKKTGTTLTVVGSALWVVGLVTLMNVSTTTTNNGSGSYTTQEGNPEAGIAAYLAGCAGIGAGIPLWIVGGVNKGRYERKLNAVTVGASVNPQNTSVTLRYRF